MRKKHAAIDNDKRKRTNDMTIHSKLVKTDFFFCWILSTSAPQNNTHLDKHTHTHPIPNTHTTKPIPQHRFICWSLMKKGRNNKHDDEISIDKMQFTFIFINSLNILQRSVHVFFCSFFLLVSSRLICIRILDTFNVLLILEARVFVEEEEEKKHRNKESFTHWF